MEKVSTTSHSFAPEPDSSSTAADFIGLPGRGKQEKLSDCVSAARDDQKPPAIPPISSLVRRPLPDGKVGPGDGVFGPGEVLLLPLGPGVGLLDLDGECITDAAIIAAIIVARPAVSQ